MDFGGGSDGDDLAEVEDQNAVGNVHDETHVVFNQNHGDSEFFANVEYETCHVFGFFKVHARYGFVEEEKLRFHGKGTTEFDSFLDAVRQHANGVCPPGLDLK